MTSRFHHGTIVFIEGTSPDALDDSQLQEVTGGLNSPAFLEDE